jgi:hypothetical protein
VAGLAAAGLLAGPVDVDNVARPDQATTVDLLSPTGRLHPAATERPPERRWIYQPDGDLVSSDLNLERLYLLQRRAERLELISVDLVTGREAWRRTLEPAAGAEVEADTNQVLVTTIGATPSAGGGGPGWPAGGPEGQDPASDPEPGSAGSAAAADQGHRVTAYDEETSNERWTVGVRAGETHASVGRWMVVAPRYTADGEVRPGTIRVFERSQGRPAWSRTASATVDAFRDDLVVEDKAGTAVLALPSGDEWDRFATFEGVSPRLVGAHELAFPTRGGLVYTARGGSSTSFVRVEGLDPASLQPVGEHLTLLDGGQGTVSVDRRTLEVVALAPPDAQERYAVGHGDEVRLLFGWRDRLMTVSADGSQRRERRFPEADQAVAGFAGWLVYLCESTDRVAAYDLRTLHGVWRVSSTERPRGSCDVEPVPGGFLAVDEHLRIHAYRS